MKLYGIKNCDTVKKARRWLDDRGIDYRFHDLRADGLDRSVVDSWLTSVAADELLNKRSTTWKSLDKTLRENLEAGDIPALLVENPTLIKRPVLEREGNLLVGFSEQAYNTYFGIQESDE